VIGAETGAELAEYQLKWSGYKKNERSTPLSSQRNWQKNRLNV